MTTASALRLASSTVDGTGAADLAVWTRQGSRWIYLLIPALFLLLGFAISVGPLRFELSALWLPVAAWLGARFGAQGFRVVLIAATPLLVGLSFGAFATVDAAGLYVATVIVCRLFGRRDYREATLAADRVTRRMLAFLFLAVPFTAGFGGGFGGVWVSLWPALGPYLWMLLVVIGLSAAPLRTTFVWLVAASLLGWLIPLLGGQPPRFMGFGASYYLGGPQAVFTGGVALLVGRIARDRLNAGGPTPRWGRRTLPLLLLLLAVSLLGSMVDIAVPTLPPGFSPVHATFGSATATVLLLFACGLVGGATGALLGAAAWLLVYTLLPLLLVAGEIALPGLGAAAIVSPRTFFTASFALAPRVSLGLFDVAFAAFGWALARSVATQSIAATPGSIPPPFRFRPIARLAKIRAGAGVDQAWAAAGALWLVATVALAAAQLVIDAD